MQIVKREIPLSQIHWLSLVSSNATMCLRSLLHKTNEFNLCFHQLIFSRFITVIEELHRFKNENQIDATAFLDRNLKMVAFNFARQSNHPPFLKMMANIFELPRDKDMFIDKIREILAEHNYKDVMNWKFRPPLNTMQID